MFGASKFNRVVQHPGYNIAPAIIGGGLSLLGGLFGSSSAKKQAKAATQAAQVSADAQVRAAQIAADAAAFSPFDMSNAFGSVDWLYGGQPTTGGYAPAPAYAPSTSTSTSTPSYLNFLKQLAQGVAGGWPTGGAISQQQQQAPAAYNPFQGKVSGMNLTPSAMVQGLSDDAMKTYQNYQGLLSQYFQPTVGAGGEQIYNEWQQLLDPTRKTQQSQLFDALQAKGITGIEGYDPRTGTSANPFANSLFNAWGTQDAQMASQSMNEYLSRLSQLMAGGDTARGSLVGVNELPINNVLNVSAALGGRNANATGSSALLQGLSGAAQTQAQGQVAGAAYKNSFWNSFAPQAGNALSGLFSSIQSPQTPPISQQQQMLNDQWNPNW